MRPRLTVEDVSDAINTACDDIKDAADIYDGPVDDALNLLVNVSLTYVCGDADSVAEAIVANYDADMNCDEDYDMDCDEECSGEHDETEAQGPTGQDRARLAQRQLTALSKRKMNCTRHLCPPS